MLTDDFERLAGHGFLREVPLVVAPYTGTAR
jgi:hypothetical protein